MSQPMDPTFAPLVPAPEKIVCVGLNYRDHILEMGRERAGLAEPDAAACSSPGWNEVGRAVRAVPRHPARRADARPAAALAAMAAAMAAAWVAAWVAPIRTRQGRTVPGGEIPWMRVREIWITAWISTPA